MALTRYVIWCFKGEEAEISSTGVIHKKPCEGWSSERINTLVVIKLTVSSLNCVLQLAFMESPKCK